MKARTRANRLARIDHVRAYDRARGNRQDANYMRGYRRKNPEKYRAHVAVGNAIRDGILIKQPCEVCGVTEAIHAHHDDYSKPLDVRWLCAAHHRQHHANLEAASTTAPLAALLAVGLLLSAWSLEAYIAYDYRVPEWVYWRTDLSAPNNRTDRLRIPGPRDER